MTDWLVGLQECVDLDVATPPRPHARGGPKYTVAGRPPHSARPAALEPGHGPQHRGAKPQSWLRALHEGAPEPSRSARPPLWEDGFRDALARLDEFTNLPRGWAGDGTAPTPRAVAERARVHVASFRMLAQLLGIALDPPWIAASADGSVGAEWKAGGRELAVTYDADGAVSFFARGEGTEVCGDVVDAAQVVALAKWLLGAEPLVFLGDG